MRDAMRRFVHGSVACATETLSSGRRRAGMRPRPKRTSAPVLTEDETVSVIAATVVGWRTTTALRPSLRDDLHGQLIVAGGLVDDRLNRSRLDTRSHALLDVVHVEIHGGGSVQVSTRRAGWFSAKAAVAQTATRSPRRSITRSTVCGAGDPFSDGVEGQNRLSSAFTRSQARLARTQANRRAARKSRPKNGWPATALNNTGASKEPASA